MSWLWIKIYLIFGFLQVINTSFCGDSALPYYLKVNRGGKLTMGCSKPTCFNMISTVKSEFVQIDDIIDGFITAPKSYSKTVNISEYTECDNVFSSKKCIKDDEWVGGIAPNEGGLYFRCCRNSAFSIAKFEDVVDLNANEVYRGGDVYSRGKLIGFDYISNIVDLGETGDFLYEIYISRIQCNLTEATKEVNRISNDKETKKLFQALLAEAENSDGVIENTELQALGNSIQEQAQVPRPRAYQAPIAVSQNPINNNRLQSLNQPQAAPSAQQQQPAPAPQSSSSSGSRAGGAGVYCFTADTEVQIFGGGKKRMDELKVYDWILSYRDGKIQYDQVISWIHRMPNVKSKFIKISLENGIDLNITPKHYIYKSDNCQGIDFHAASNNDLPEMVYAEDVKESDCLFVHDQNKKNNTFYKTKIVKIESYDHEGVYSPLTYGGNIIVNDIFASCYSNLNDEFLQKMMAYWHRLMTETLLLFGTQSGIRWQDQSEIDIIPGLNLVIDIVKLILPLK